MLIIFIIIKRKKKSILKKTKHFKTTEYKFYFTLNIKDNYFNKLHFQGIIMGLFIKIIYCVRLSLYYHLKFKLSSFTYVWYFQN